MTEYDGKRNVFKFKLEITKQNELKDLYKSKKGDIPFNRQIPGHIKLEVYKRDKGICVECAKHGITETKNLHFDHDLPFSKGGTSIDPKNIRLLCPKHNLKRSNKIEKY